METKIISIKKLSKKISKGKDLSNIYIGDLDSRGYGSDRFLMYNIKDVQMEKILKRPSLIVEIIEDEE